MYSLHRYVGQIAQVQIRESSNPTLEQLRSGIDELHAEIHEPKAYDASATAGWMPGQYIAWSLEYNHRASSVPSCSGPGVVTPDGRKPGAAGSVVSGWTLPLRRSEQRVTAVPLVNCEWITGDSYV